MKNFIIFFLGALSNVIIIKNMPNEYVHGYLNGYIVVGACAAFAFFFVYTRRSFADHIRKVGISIVGIYTILHILLSPFWAAAFMYPLLIIFNDYIATQGDHNQGQNWYRIFLVITALPILAFPEYFEILFGARAFLLTVILIFYIINTNSVALLSVRATWKYLFFQYVFYNGPLLVVVNLPFTPIAVKFWYIFTQGGLVVYLKFLDFSLRKNSVVPYKYRLLIIASGLSAPFLPSLLFPNFFAMAAYFVGLGGLIYSTKYLSLGKSIQGHH